MGCPIRSEIWGIISIGNHKLASQYAYMDATLDHADNSVYAEQFLAAVESMAFVEQDMSKLIQIGMSYIPVDSRLYKCFKMIIKMFNDGKNWLEVRTEVLNKYSHPDFTNVVQNLGFVLIALLWGNADMRETINIALKCGYDTDCTCASAASVVGIINGYKSLGGEITDLINDYFICSVDIELESDSIRDLAETTVRLAMKAPNDKIDILDAPVKFEKVSNFHGFNIEYPTEEGLNKAFENINPIKWDVYGPFFDQLNQPINTDFPSPHGEGCVLPDLVCMVNNEVFLNKEYITDFETARPACTINACEDFIEIDKALTLEGQMCCYAKTKIYSQSDRTVWAIIGNNDGFRLMVNGNNVLKKDEIRLWTPYNNFALIDLKKGENEIIVKLLRRTERLKFGIGFRIYDGGHWHRSKWCTDLT